MRAINYKSDFDFIPKLKDRNGKEVRFPDCDWEAVLWVSNKAANTAAITVTVHPDVYAKLSDETNAEWHALLAQAAEKNIIFATL